MGDYYVKVTGSKALPKDYYDTIVELRNAGKTSQEIVKLTGIPTLNVNAVLRSLTPTKEQEEWLDSIVK